eukprot:1154881-Pelagomonas_calceolata.AAC.5
MGSASSWCVQLDARAALQCSLCPFQHGIAHHKTILEFTLAMVCPAGHPCYPPLLTICVLKHMDRRSSLTLCV